MQSTFLSPHQHFLHRTEGFQWPVHLLCDLCTKIVCLLRRLMVTSLKAVTMVVPVNLLAGWNIFVGLFL